MVYRFKLRHRLTGESVEGIASSKMKDDHGQFVLIVEDEVATWADFQVVGNPVVFNDYLADVMERQWVGKE